MNTALFLFVNEGAVFPVDGTPPSGEYGTDWIVVRARNASDADTVGKAYLWEQSWATDGTTRVLSREHAMAAFEVAS